MIYGLSPVDPELADTSALRPVLRRVVTRLIQVTSDDGLPVMGVVPFGRADGNRAPADGRGAHYLIDGNPAPVLRVSLEHAVIDLSAVAMSKVGGEVVIIGRSADAEVGLMDVAAWQGGSTNDVLMALNERLPTIPVTGT